MAYPWEQGYQDEWAPAIDQLGPYQPGPYDQPASEQPYQSQGLAYGKMGGGGVGAGPNPTGFGRTKLAHGIEDLAQAGAVGLQGLGQTIGGALASPFEPWVDPAAARPSAGATRPPAAPAAPVDAPEELQSHEEVPALRYNFSGMQPGERPAINSALTDDFGHTATALDSQGGGGFGASASLRGIPFSQWPPSARRDAFKAAELQKAQLEAQDPYQTGAYAQRKLIDLHASAEDRAAQVQEDMDFYQKINGRREARLRQLAAKNPPPSPAEQKQFQSDIQAEFDRDNLAYQQARQAARPGALSGQAYSPR